MIKQQNTKPSTTAKMGTLLQGLILLILCVSFHGFLVNRPMTDGLPVGDSSNFDAAEFDDWEFPDTEHRRYPVTRTFKSTGSNFETVLPSGYESDTELTEYENIIYSDNDDQHSTTGGHVAEVEQNPSNPHLNYGYSPDYDLKNKSAGQDLHGLDNLDDAMQEDGEYMDYEDLNFDVLTSMFSPVGGRPILAGEDTEDQELIVGKFIFKSFLDAHNYARSVKSAVYDLAKSRNPSRRDLSLESRQWDSEHLNYIRPDGYMILSSVYKGVKFDNVNMRWVMDIEDLDGGTSRFGYFDDPIDAAYAYDSVMHKIYPGTSKKVLNDIDEKSVYDISGVQMIIQNAVEKLGYK